MAKTEATDSWVSLTSDTDKIIQCRSGRMLVSSDTSPGDDDGVEIVYNDRSIPSSVGIPSGKVVKVKRRVGFEGTYDILETS